VRRLDLNRRGHFSDWPKGFFDEAYQEAMALATAASKKG
jgi:predicted ATPase